MAKRVDDTTAHIWGHSPEDLRNASFGERSKARLFTGTLLLGGAFHATVTAFCLQGLGLSLAASVATGTLSSLLWMSTDLTIVRVEREHRAAKEHWEVAGGAPPTPPGPARYVRYAAAFVYMAGIGVGGTIQFMDGSIDQRRAEMQEAIDEPYRTAAEREFGKIRASAEAAETSAVAELGSFDAGEAEAASAHGSAMEAHLGEARRLTAARSALEQQWDAVSADVARHRALAACEVEGVSANPLCEGATGAAGPGGNFRLATLAAEAGEARLREIDGRIAETKAALTSLAPPVAPEPDHARRDRLVADVRAAAAAKAETIEGGNAFVEAAVAGNPGRRVLTDNLFTRISILGDLFAESWAFKLYAFLLEAGIVAVELTVLMVGGIGRPGLLDLAAEHRRRAGLLRLAKDSLGLAADIAAERNNVVFMDKFRRETEADGFTIFGRGDGDGPPAAE
ncbi:DUF4407 domain-containing protein [Antarcticirhabdus aurantiaca]|uniref:DUF4407 domain-containing protein n=1 Tax=Antarcticirhabdus aurantiaca TaxID=2606717 RepID=A0ACD4NRI4_9HYPH|nr:DUF4407 domain-containing protein [Antarcticirhabdus aurantiaca]WAJ29454.1 DUF4407 domain-containing protein [Jeongeuplla avenae]